MPGASGRLNPAVKNSIIFLNFQFFSIFYFCFNYMNYTELTLNESLSRGISEAGYVKCTPVQEEVLKVSLDGSDLYVQSQTGTGKTAAFLITIMQQLLSGARENSKTALVLVPTRELAVQVEEEACKLGKFTGLKSASFYGGVGYEEQIKRIAEGIDVIIGTPGRIIDLTESKKLNLKNVGYLAIDEADRMFDMGFYPDLRKILRFLPDSENRQTMLFSATLNSYVKNLAWEYTKNAREITIEAENITVDEIDQELIHVSSDDKISLLLGILAREKPESLIIFCNTKKMCQILSKRLTLNNVKNEYIIGDLPQSKRLKIMDKFKYGKISCLIATDVAARGIDVNDLAMVVNFDLPNEAENYVHRIGRTARAGKSGKAYTFCSEQDVYSLMPIERYIEKQIPSRLAEAAELAEDKSKNVFIRLDDDRKNRRTEDRKSRFSDSRKENRTKSSGKKDKSDNKKVSSKRSFKKEYSRSSKEELDKLNSMTSEERMKYYKSKFVSESKNAGGKGKSFRKNNNNLHRTDSKLPKNQVKKSGLFDKIKRFFGK